MSNKKSLAKTVITSMMGNLFEWYDFALFGYFAPIIGKLFFPSEDRIVELLAAFGAFAAGYVSRPLGGILFGYIADKYGRKTSLVWTILVMALPTALIGILPTYTQIGVLAPALLIFIRILQGLSMGGNYGGSITFTSEHSPKNRRGLIGSFAVASCLVGLMLGSATAAIFTTIFTEQDLNTWAWRIPFLLGILICIIGFYMRRNVPESPVYEKAQETGDLVKNPLSALFHSHGSTLSIMVLIVMLHDLSFYIMFVYMTTHLTEFLHLSKSMAFTINTLNMLFVIAVTIGSAWLSDKFGRRAVMSCAALFFVLTTVPLMMLLNTTTSYFYIYLAQAVIAIGVGGYFGPLPALMVEAYPTAVRSSGVSLTTNISGPLFGGTAPYLVTYLIDATGSTMVPGYYLTGAAVVSLFALMALKSRFDV